MSNIKISVLVVNLNNLQFTKDCISDLLLQDIEYNITIIDQNSTEEGTKEYFSTLPNTINFIQNNQNVPLNHLWNWFVEKSNTPYICLLNNDVRIAPNFLSSAIEVFEKEPNVGFVNHVSNNKDYQEWSNKLDYRIIETPYRQGWDPIFRKECYNQIPNELSFFYGDDYIYSKLYSSGMKGAYVLNSPMIHFERSTTIEKGGQRDASPDGSFFHQLDLEFKNMSFVEEFSKWKPEFETIKSVKLRAYITHVTRDYLDVAINLAKSIQLFSNIPLIVYCIGLEDSDKEKFKIFNNVSFRNINLDIKSNNEDYVINSSGNFYINRNSTRIYHILCAKTIAMQMALEDGLQEVCYLDSDCLATPFVDELFDWINIVSDFPIATEGIHEYMVMIENGIQRGNPFANTWPQADNTLSLEWPLMSFMQMNPEQRGRYRTTGIMLMNQNCLPFIKTWRELCFLLPKLVDTTHYAPYHEETIYNVLSWKKENKGFPLCYINLGEGLETVRHFYSEESKEGNLRWSDTDTSQNFYKIPDDKRYVKVLHGEKRTTEVNRILDFLTQDSSIDNVIIQVDTFITNEKSEELTIECISRLKELKLPILLTSHLPIPDHIKNMVDFYEEDLNNILLPPGGKLSIITFDSANVSSEIIVENSDSHAPACLTSIINGAKFAKNHNFKYFIRFEYDVILKKDQIYKIDSLIKNNKKRGFVFGNESWIDGKIIMLNAFEYLEAFNKEIQSSDDYLSFIRENNIPLRSERHLQNVQYLILNSKGYLDGVRFIPTYIIEEMVDIEYLDNKVNPGIFKPVYFNESSFATICHGWGKGDVNINIYHNESLLLEYNQTFIKGLTYKIFDFIPDSQYKIVVKHKYTNKKEFFNFSTLEDLKRMGSLIIKNN